MHMSSLSVNEAIADANADADPKLNSASGNCASASDKKDHGVLFISQKEYRRIRSTNERKESDDRYKLLEDPSSSPASFLWVWNADCCRRIRKCRLPCRSGTDFRLTPEQQAVRKDYLNYRRWNVVWPLVWFATSFLVYIFLFQILGLTFYLHKPPTIDFDFSTEEIIVRTSLVTCIILGWIFHMCMVRYCFKTQLDIGWLGKLVRQERIVFWEDVVQAAEEAEITFLVKTLENCTFGAYVGVIGVPILYLAYADINSNTVGVAFGYYGIALTVIQILVDRLHAQFVHFCKHRRWKKGEDGFIFGWEEPEDVAAKFCGCHGKFVCLIHRKLRALEEKSRLNVVEEKGNARQSCSFPKPTERHSRQILEPREKEDEKDDVENESNSDLRRRVENLEKSVAELRDLLERAGGQRWMQFYVGGLLAFVIIIVIVVSIVLAVK